MQNASALSIDVFAPANVGIDAGSFSWGICGSAIHLYENCYVSGHGFLIFDGLSPSTDYTVVKHIYNYTGADWKLFSNELQDLPGQQEDIDYDPTQYPGFVAARFSTSSDNDVLSFAKGSGIP